MLEKSAIITRYRPQSFEECLGNQEVIRSLSEAVKSPSRPHSYLFTGGPGIGKTTLARIIAKEIKASIEEIDGASNSGVDDTRRLAQMSIYKPITSEPNKMFIINECHALSKQAWQPLLTLTEEPPPWLYFAFTTTQPNKVDEAIKTRCHPISLKPLRPNEIEELLDVVIEMEGWKVDNNVFQGIVIAAQGSARRALSYLQAGHSCLSKDDLSRIILDVDSENNPAIKIAQSLLRGVGSWTIYAPLLKELDGEEEAAIQSISRYLANSLVKSEDGKAQHIWSMLNSFAETDTWDKKIHLYSAVGKILWA